MKNHTLIIILILMTILLLVIFSGTIKLRNFSSPEEMSQDSEIDQIEDENINSQNLLSEPEVIIENLTVPWDFTFLPENKILLSERPGRLVLFDLKTKESKTIEVSEVAHSGEGGLLGLTLHPEFESNNWLYLYLTFKTDGGFSNRVERYRFNDGKLTENKTVISNIPGAPYHDGGRLEFGPDGYLYITTGDAGRELLAQDRNSLAGKILRVKDDGSIPEDNPFFKEGSEQAAAVWSIGHRNPQGLTWDNQGRLWSTEHGRSGILSGLDELNLIEKGGNYGWPDSQGDKVLPDTIAPAYHSGANKTWAPASALYYKGSIFFGGLRGEALYRAVFSGYETIKVVELREYFKGEFGRIRTVRLGPDDMFYMSTSNQDGRGKVREGDDKIIRIDPQQFMFFKPS